jgi:hypothetical protein
MEPGSSLTLPEGTRVVTRIDSTDAHGGKVLPGTVGTVVGSPAGPASQYTVRFADGREATLQRSALTVLKHMQGDFCEPAESSTLFKFVIYRCVVGSRAYGLENEDSDTDYRGVYLPPSDLHWSLGGVPEQLSNDATQECYWELRKFLVLALKANPNVLECLYTPLVTLATPLAEELLQMRSAFLSRMVYQTYNGYARSQFKKLEQDLRNRQGLKWKHVMHLIRLLLAGIAVLDEAQVPVKVTAHRERLLAVRRGEVKWPAVNQWRLDLHAQFEQAVRRSSLPERPDYGRANAFLVRARRSMVTP